MGDRASWTERHRTRREARPPSPFIVEALACLAPPAPGARALDVACGRGRHALALARAGYAVLGADWSVPALQTLRRRAQDEGYAVACIALDVATWTPPAGRYAVVLSTNFLDRPCLARLRDAVAPGGALLLETFLEGQQHYGHPSNPAYLLRPGELATLCDGWDVLHTHEGVVGHGADAAVMAGILARRPPTSAGGPTVV